MTVTGVIDRAAAAARRGDLVVTPTDTVYGIGALPGVPGAIARIYAAKARPEDKPIPLLAARADDLRAAVDFDRRAEVLGARFWPGPLTLVLPRARGFDADLGGSGSASVAVRVPAHPAACALLELTGVMAVTSANRSGEPPATTVDAARAALGAVVSIYVDGGECRGAPSTVVSLLGDMAVVREGPLSLEQLEEALRRAGAS